MKTQVYERQVALGIMAAWVLVGLIMMAICSMSGMCGDPTEPKGKNVWYPCLTPSCEEFTKDAMGAGAATAVNASSAGSASNDLSIIDMPALAHMHVQDFDHQATAFPARKMKICDNFVTSDIAAKFGRSGVRKSIHTLITWMEKNPISGIKPFAGAWRSEMGRVMGPTIKVNDVGAR